MLETRHDGFRVLATLILLFRDGRAEKGSVRDDLPLAPLDLPARISVMPLRAARRYSDSGPAVPSVKGPKLYAHCQKARGRSDKLNVINATHDLRACIMYGNAFSARVK